MHYVILVFCNVLVIAQNSKAGNVRIALRNLNHSNASACLEDAPCTPFYCGNDGSPMEETSVKSISWAGEVKCQAEDKINGVEVTLSRRWPGNADLAWNVLAGTFNLIPIVIFISIFVYYYIFKNNRASREKKELKSIFQSLGYEDDGVLCKKIHDFIYA